MSNFSFAEFMVAAVKAVREMEMDELMADIEDFNKRNYKDAAIDVALATGDREAFEKIGGGE